MGNNKFLFRHSKFIYIYFLSYFIYGLLYGQVQDSIITIELPEKYCNNRYIYPINSKESIIFEKPGPFQSLTNAPKDLFNYTKNVFQLKNLMKISGMAALTTFFVVLDQDIVDGSKKLGKKLNIEDDNNMKTITEVFGFPVEFPDNLGLALYFIGDGWTHTIITSSFFSYGLIKSDARALQTSSQLVEALITVTFTIQLLKHITGRESPYVSTKSGGRWIPLPNQIEYHKHVPHYDAFPSGHLASAMATLTIISENYKEYKFIKPVGYILMTLLSFQMLNNGVHWFSDYPLGLAIGYAFAKLSLSRGRTVIKHKTLKRHIINEIDLGFKIINMNGIGLSCQINF